MPNCIISHRRFSLLFVALICAAPGCQSEVEKLRAEHGEAADAKLATVREILERASEAPAASDAYARWVHARQQVDEWELLAESDRLDAETVKAAAELVEQAQPKLEEAFAAASLEVPSAVDFANDAKKNAATLMLGEDGGVSGADFRLRNLIGAAWFVYGPPPEDAEAAARWYRQLADLEYLLVLRQTDIVEPEFEQMNDQEQAEYSMGAIECDASLFRLGKEQPIGSFRFVAPNQHSAASIAGTDMFLSNVPEHGVATLRQRLFAVAHEFAAAVAAELSPEIHYDKHVVRDLLGIRLESNEPRSQDQP